MPWHAVKYVDFDGDGYGLWIGSGDNEGRYATCRVDREDWERLTSSPGIQWDNITDAAFWSKHYCGPDGAEEGVARLVAEKMEIG